MTVASTSRRRMSKREEEPGADRTGRDLMWSSVFSYILVLAILVVLIFYLISIGEFMFVLGFTRLLDLMVRSGIVQLHDGQLGIIPGGVELLDAWFASQDPVDTGLVVLAILLLMATWAIRAMQFHGIAQFCGLDTGLGTNVRTHLYARGLDLFLPYNASKAAIVSNLSELGSPPAHAVLAAFTGQMFGVFEIMVFGLIGVVHLGWTSWFQLVAWAGILVGAAYLLVYGWQRRGASARNLWNSARAVTHALLSDTRTLVRVGSLSLLAFALEVAVIYALGNAFTGPNVVLLVEPPLIMMALIAGYLASSIKVTPGGAGQFELAFGAALYLGEMGFANMVALTLIYMAIRYLVGAIMLGAVTLGYGTGTNLAKVGELLRNPPQDLGTLEQPGSLETAGASAPPTS